MDSVCTMQSVHEDPNFIPKSLKRAVQDFSPFLGIQPDMRQHKQRLQARPRADITSLESVTDPHRFRSLLSFHYTLLSPGVFIFLPAPPRGCSSAVPASPLPPGVQRGAGSTLEPARQELPAGCFHCALTRLLQQSPSLGRRTVRSTDITTSLNKLLISDSISTPQICFQSLLCLSSCFALSQLLQAVLSAAFRY